MDNETFLAALGKLAGRRGSITQSRLIELSGVPQSTLSGYVNGTSEPKKPGYKVAIIEALKKELGLTESQIEEIGRQKIALDKQKVMIENTGSMSGTAPAPTIPVEGSNITTIEQEHVKVIQQFQQKELALEINQLLLAVERNNPALLEVIKAQLSGMAAECYPAPQKKRPAANDKG